MSKFKQTDTVRIIAPRCSYFDRTGMVSEVRPGEWNGFLVTGLEPWGLWFNAAELVLAEHEPVEAA